MKPITPEQVKKNFEIPNAAIKVINDLIVENFTGSESIFTKGKLDMRLDAVGFRIECIIEITNKMPIIYKKYGWNVQETENGYIFQELLN